MKPLEKLTRRPAVTTVDSEGAVAFTKTPAPGLLLLPGEPSRPEVTDVAVVVIELSERHPELRLGVARVGDEAAMRERFGVTTFPALLFVRNGEVVRAVSRMQSWATYMSAVAMLEGRS